ncbi:glucan biosynthesis protein D [Methylobacterium sp. R2-1]|uniref:glucan biosynthesis protein D n=1 Tax=Methylobacterium sp. R2-1 TaxID=2587064 RepID=UPI001617CB5A|nr:glucan biosynthesis protein D [Methylobacterium sp. R2-1]MBB2964450.1 glucans biosynthesis protein [Methylobacterium sp. R2-1]
MTHPTDPSTRDARLIDRSLDRRRLIGGAAAGAALALLPRGASAQAAPPALPAAGSPFSDATVPDLARALGNRPFAGQPTNDVPDALKNLPREAYEAIRIRPEALIWGGEPHGFAVEPLVRGFYYTDRVALFLVEDGVVRPILYDRGRYVAGSEAGAAALPETEPGFSGLRIRARFGEQNQDFAVFQGACFYRLVGQGQEFGINGRALMLRPADPRGEEFPRWRALFVERPKTPDGPLVIHALIDSDSLAAALRLELRPGGPSTAAITATLVTRKAIDHLGLSGMQAPFLFGPHDRRGADDARAAVYAAGGLQIRNGGGEAIWRPVRNPETLQISGFLDNGPKGFGLTQRDRSPATFEDDVHHWERCPSLWVEPGEPAGEGLWGEGAVTLLEIPSDSEVNENVIAYWRPKANLPAGQEVRLTYRQNWGGEPPVGPLARVTSTRSGRGTANPRRLFLVDFTGDLLFTAAGTMVPLDTVLMAGPGRIVEGSTRRIAHPETRTVRVAFELDPGSERAVELRLALKTEGRQVTETWLYRWTP